jgi:hypothetical protein
MENMLLDISTMLNHPTIMLDPPTPQTIKMEDLVTAAPSPPAFMTLPDTLAVPGTSTETTTDKSTTSDPAKPPPKKRKVSTTVIKSSI